ncbi:MAG: hypothetical protein NUV91_01695, partial [Candidatus Omnitrophica bacterium]|nr:hypothetical protein [Candidatus Omnitrophota bacterium]
IYNPQGLLTELRDALNNVTRLTYNGQGNLSTVTDPRQSVTRLAYDQVGNLSSLTDALNRITNLEYDTMNRLTRELDAANGVTRYSYDSAGNLLSVEDARNGRTAYEYDVLDRLVRTTDPLGRSDVFIYDGNGNLLSTTDRKNQVLSFEYDVVDQLLRKVLPNNLVTSFTYDRNGNLSSVIDPDSAVSFVYDGASRLTRASTANSPLQPAVAVDYTYDLDGNRLSMTATPVGGQAAALGVTSYIYDALNRLDQLTSPTGGVFDFGYDALSRRNQLILPNGVRTTYAYDQASQLTNLTHLLPNAQRLSAFDYVYDAVGNRTRMTQDRRNPALAGLIAAQLNYVYDPLYRLTQATRPLAGQANETFTYDSLGNRVRRDGQAADAHFDAGNRLLDDAQFIYTYDNNGNLISKQARANGQLTRYTYDAENQLIRIDLPAAGFAEYKYDGLGRRIQKNANGEITKYVYDNEDIVLEFSRNSSLKSRYTHGLGIDEPLLMERDVNGNAQLAADERFAYHTDGLGSIVDLTNNLGTIVQSYTYDSFGTILRRDGNLENPYTYTAREFDPESNLYYYRARYYDPSIGRFLQEDPLGYYDSMNLFQYVYDNPINYFDPYGYGYFYKRKLEVMPFWFPGLSKNRWLDIINQELSHEHYFYDDGTNVGYGRQGVFFNEKLNTDYIKSSEYYNDALMHQAQENIEKEWKGEDYCLSSITVCGKINNCQSFADALRREYMRLKKGKEKK